MGYSPARKSAVLKRMLPPDNLAIRQLSQDGGISEATLHEWRAEARSKGQLLPDADAGPIGWSSRDKFAAWRTACEQANDWDRASTARLGQQATKEEKKRIKGSERDLARKDRALAETAALLVLRKKASAIWGDEDV
jgi:transposase-like protein